LNNSNFPLKTNLQFNNNKYYIIQLLEKMKSKEYVVWMRWGRVGKNGQNTLESCGSDLDLAKNIFCDKFYDKTKNNWSEKEKFIKYAGKYDLVEKDYNSNVETIDEATKKQKEENENAKKKPIPPSKLDKRLQDLIELICNVNDMEDMLKEMKYDAKKAPLGKLSKNQIKAGYAALKEIEEHIQNKSFGASFVQANNEFYTRIPHDFGFFIFF
jgi:poly [ADP-ribose] polymerase 2/3/4